MSRFILFFALLPLCPLAPAQVIGAGLKGGVVFGDWAPDMYGKGTVQGKSDSYTVGPYVELRLPWSLAIEADALYRPYRQYSMGHMGISSTVGTARTWEYPLLAKYRLRLGPLNPFAVGGVTFRHMGQRAFVTTCTSTLCTSPDGTTVFSYTQGGFTSTGYIAGGGLEWKLRGLRLSTEARYTRIPDPFNGGAAYISGHVWVNQTTLLFSIGF